MNPLYARLDLEANLKVYKDGQEANPMMLDKCCPCCGTPTLNGECCGCCKDKK